MPNKQLALYILTAIAVVWGIACFNPFLLWFQNDDFSHILLSSRDVMFQHNSFRPVCDLSVILDYHIWGRYAAGYHITNLVLHAVCAVLVYFFSRRVAQLHFPQTNQHWFALLAASLFFVYPFHSEAVFWILGRSGILGAIFSLLFLLFFLKERPTAASRAIGLAAYLAALLTYESSWVLPFIAFILQKRSDGTPVSSKIKRYYVLAIIFGGYLFVRYMVIRQVVAEYEGLNFLQFNVINLFLNFYRLVAMSFTAWRDTPVVLQVLFLAALAIPVYALIKRPAKPAWRFFACFLVSLAPYLSLGIDTHGTEGERFLYLPSVFVVLLVAAGIAGIKNTYVRYFATGFTVILYAAQLYITAANYRFAGEVVKQTITQITSAPEGATITIEGLPKSQHGALILANGLPDAQAWYLPGNKANIKILSWRYELNPLQQPYKTIVLPSSRGTKDIKYVFTDSALVIYQ